MNVQNGEKLRDINNNNIYVGQAGGYNYDEVQRQINNVIPTVDYQSVFNPRACTDGDRQFYNQMKRAVECGYNPEDTEFSHLDAAIDAGKLMAQKPYSCMIDLINNYSSCYQEIPLDKRQAAYKAFVDVTGYKQPNLDLIFNNVEGSFDALVNFNSFYMFAPTLIMFLIIIWLMVGFKWMTLGLGLFFTVLVIVVYYSFTIAYRINFEYYMRTRRQTIKNQTNLAQNAFENSIAYWPQGLMAAACAVTCDNPEDCWTCHGGPNCPPCRPGYGRCPVPNPNRGHLTPEEITIEEQLINRRLGR